MSISSKLTIAMGEIDINYIYDTSHNSSPYNIPAQRLTTSKRRLY